MGLPTKEGVQAAPSPACGQRECIPSPPLTSTHYPPTLGSGVRGGEKRIGKSGRHSLDCCAKQMANTEVTGTGAPEKRWPAAGSEGYDQEAKTAFHTLDSEAPKRGREQTGLSLESQVLWTQTCRLLSWSHLTKTSPLSADMPRSLWA